MLAAANKSGDCRKRENRFHAARIPPDHVRCLPSAPFDPSVMYVIIPQLMVLVSREFLGSIHQAIEKLTLEGCRDKGGLAGRGDAHTYLGYAPMCCTLPLKKCRAQGSPAGAAQGHCPFSTSHDGWKDVRDSWHFQAAASIPLISGTFQRNAREEDTAPYIIRPDTGKTSRYLTR